MNLESSQNASLKNSLLFTALALASGWLGVLIDWYSQKPTFPGLLVWVLVPFLSALYLGKNNLRQLLLPRFNQAGEYYQFALLYYPLVIMVIVNVGRYSGVINFACPLQNQPLFFVKTLFVMAVYALGKTFVEELFWRGWLGPRLQQAGVKPMLASAITGLLWGLWQLPYLKYVMGYLPSQATGYWHLFLLASIVLGVLLNALRLVSKSIWPGVVLLGIARALTGVLYSLGIVNFYHGGAWLFAPGIPGLLFVIVSLPAIWWLFRRYKRG